MKRKLILILYWSKTSMNSNQIFNKFENYLTYFYIEQILNLFLNWSFTRPR